MTDESLRSLKSGKRYSITYSDGTSVVFDYTAYLDDEFIEVCVNGRNTYICAPSTAVIQPVRTFTERRVESLTAADIGKWVEFDPGDDSDAYTPGPLVAYTMHHDDVGIWLENDEDEWNMEFGQTVRIAD